MVILLFLPSRLRNRLRNSVPLLRMTDLALLIIALSAVFTVLLKRVEGIRASCRGAEQVSI